MTVRSYPARDIPTTYRVLRSSRWRGIKMDSEWPTYEQAAVRATEIHSKTRSAVTIVKHPYEL